MSAVRGGGICGSKRQRLLHTSRVSPSTSAHQPRGRRVTRRYDRELGLAAFYNDAKDIEEEDDDASSVSSSSSSEPPSSSAPTPLPPSAARPSSPPPPPTHVQSRDGPPAPPNLHGPLASASPSLLPPLSTSSSVEMTWDSIDGEELEESKCGDSAYRNNPHPDPPASNCDGAGNDKDDSGCLNNPPPALPTASAPPALAPALPQSFPRASSSSGLVTAPVAKKQRRRSKTGTTVGLCLGMIRMQDTFMEGYKGYADPLLDLPAARDTRRMRALETEMKMDVIGLCDSRELEGVDKKGKHVSGLFENPPLRDLMRALRGRKISFICGDYIRFPPQYLRRAYRAVAKHLLVALRHSGLLAPQCHVYLPYLKQHNGMENVFEGVMADKTMAPLLVSEHDNPLYRATRTLFDEEHLHKCEGLMPGTPFLRLTL